MLLVCDDNFRHLRSTFLTFTFPHYQISEYCSLLALVGDVDGIPNDLVFVQVGCISLSIDFQSPFENYGLSEVLFMWIVLNLWQILMTV